MRDRLLVCAAILLIAACSYWILPGHAYLTSDTQIYLPILEHLDDPQVFANDPVAVRPHVAYTIYDEVAMVLRRSTGAPFQAVLQGQQVVYRCLSLFAVFFLVLRTGLRTGPALLATAIFALGAFIAGPAVMVFEVEPVPRGFAVPFLLCALALVAYQCWEWAAVAASIAFLFHPPAAITFCMIFAALAIWRTRTGGSSHLLRGLVILALAACFLALTSRFHPDTGEARHWLGRVPPGLEQLQRMRASYNWLSMWPLDYLVQYPLLWLASLVAYARVRNRLPGDLRLFVLGLPVLGLLSMPVSYLLLDVMKWELMPQLQPARSLLFVTVSATLLSLIAGSHAARRGRWGESLGWLALALAPPANTDVIALVRDIAKNPLVLERAVLVVLLAAAGVLALWLERRWTAWGTVACLAAGLALFPTLAGPGQVTNFPVPETPELQALAGWARASTPQNSVFLFPEANRSLAPGVFRVRALRTVYVDWKGGGQINFLPRFADLWWARWQRTMNGKLLGSDDYAGLGIDFVVLRPGSNALPAPRVFENAAYAVYRIEHTR